MKRSKLRKIDPGTVLDPKRRETREGHGTSASVTYVGRPTYVSGHKRDDAVFHVVRFNSGKNEGDLSVMLEKNFMNNYYVDDFLDRPLDEIAKLRAEFKAELKAALQAQKEEYEAKLQRRGTTLIPGAR